MPKFVALVLALVSTVCAECAIASIVEQIEKDLEIKRMTKLEAVKKNNSIVEFSSDGCSGGMSAGWEFFADRLPLYEKLFGARPPWHACCVAHDKVYWQGETEGGFENRKQADLELKSCVITKGVELAPILQEKMVIGQKEIELAFKLAGELMYRAVRVGGTPCTVFPWRWGFGWPKC